jgi:hypothetical protein
VGCISVWAELMEGNRKLVFKFSEARMDEFKNEFEF